MAKDSIELWGMNEINQLLRELPNSLQFKFIQDTYTEIFKAGFVKTAKQLAPESSEEWLLTGKRIGTNHLKGNLKRSIGTVKGNSKRNPTVFGGIRSNKVFKKGGKKDDGWYAHMIEYGHYRTNNKREGNGQRKLYYVLPKPFLRPAWDINKNKSMSLIYLAFGKQVDRFVKRMTKKITKSR